MPACLIFSVLFMAPHLLQRSLDDLISKEAIHTVVQPIVDLRRQCALGYEALSRGEQGHLLQRPDLMFQAAHQFDRIPELELLCIRSAVQHFAAEQSEGLLFLNVCPQSLLNYAEEISSLTLLLQQRGLQPANVVLEISERFPIDNTAQFLTLLSHLKELGYSIAIDDLGSGYSGLKLWSEIRPHYVKIDRHFIDRIDQDPVKQAFVTSVVQLCEQLQCEVIAEGIETQGELNLIRSLGIHIGQGYLLGKPQSQPAFLTPERTPAPAPNSYGKGLEQPIGNLCQNVRAIDAQLPMRQVDELFRTRPELMSLPVLEQQRPVGLLERRRLLEAFALPYGRALFERKTASHFMQQNPLIVDASMTLETVSKIITDDTEHELPPQIIVTHAGEYQGVVNSKDLLKHITDSQLQKARYANPLTLLPGNVPVDEHIASLLRVQQNFSLLYADLNYFKPFNDHYGYRQGDAVLRWLGKLLQQFSSRDTFVGHIGGDDFVLISEEPNIARLCDDILQGFASGVTDFLSTEDRQRGYIPGTDRAGNACHLPLLSLAIGVVPSTLLPNNDPQTLAQLAAQAKHLAKQKSASAWHLLGNSHPPLRPALRAVQL